MGKIDIFKVDNHIGDRVVIYRNFGNEDIEGIVAEIGDEYVVLIRDNGRKSRVFEDIISGWDTIDSSPSVQEEASAALPASSEQMPVLEKEEPEEQVIEDHQPGAIVQAPDALSVQDEEDGGTVAIDEPEVLAGDSSEEKTDSHNDSQETVDTSRKMGFTIVGKIDLSKCGDPRFRKIEEESHSDAKLIGNQDQQEQTVIETISAPNDNQVASETEGTVSIPAEDGPLSSTPHESSKDGDSEVSVVDPQRTIDLDYVKSFLKGQLEPLNSTFSVDDDSVITALENISLDYLNATKVVHENAHIVGASKTFCMIEKGDGVALKCYYSRVADYNILYQLRNFEYGSSIPVLACTYIQKSTGKEIVTAVCGLRSPKEYIEELIHLVDERNYVFAKLLYDDIRFNSVIIVSDLTRANKTNWRSLGKEFKAVNFSQLELPMISLDLKESSDSAEKSIFKLTEYTVKRLVDAGNVSGAIEQIDKTIDDNSLSSKYVSNLMLRRAQLYSSIDDTGKAQQAYIDLISYNESVGASKNNLSHLYTELARLLLLSPETQAQAIVNLDKAIFLNPANKVAAALKAQATTTNEESGDSPDVSFVLETGSNSSVLSKMIDIDIQEHRFTDREILERNNTATPEIALRLYEEAIQSMEPERYPKYLEAAKAFSGLKVGSYNLQNYLYVIANYSRLKGNYLCNSVKRLALSTSIESQDVSIIRRLKDSAQSYYLETLDLWSSISGDSFDVENISTNSEASNDEVLGVVLEILANYLKLDVAHYYFSNHIACDYNAIFTSNFSQIFNQCIKSKNAELEKIAYHTVIQIGSYSIQVWNKLSQMKEGTRSMYEKFKYENSRVHIYELINGILGAQIDTSLSAGPFLKKSFTIHADSRNSFEKKSASLQSEVLGPHNIAEITEKWESLSIYWSLLSETETETKDKISEILAVLKPYLSRKDTERTNLLIKAQSIIDYQIQFINDNTTYYGRTFFFPLLNKWRKELKNILDERIALTNPILDVKGDPMYILDEEGKRVLNLVITNTGESSADGFELSLDLVAGEHQESITISNKEYEIPAGDRTPVKIDLTDKAIVGEKVINVKAWVSPYYLSNLLPAIEYDFSIESEEEAFNLTEADILWSDTRTPDSQLFVGREEILNRLVRHYSSIEKHEPYVLYGLTRTGKSSILRYLGETINGKSFWSRDGKSYNIIPIFIDFSQGASFGKASDFWNYVINECVFPQLEDFSISYEVFKCNGENPRKKDFDLLLTDLKGIGLYPLFLIDEFSYIRTLIDKDIINAAFLHTLRQYSLDGKASFIYAGTYDVKSLIKDARYGFTGAMVTAHDEEIGKIDPEPAEELMDAMHNDIVFTDDAKSRIHELSGDIPYFIQIICKNLGFFAVENKRKYIGYPELEKIVNILTGKEAQNRGSLVRELPENRFQNNQYSPLDPPEVVVLISSIVEKNRGLKIPRGVSYAELQDMWGSHGISDFRPKLASAIGLLVEKKVLQEYQDDGMQVYRLSVDLFRLWWENHHKDINRELSTIM